MKKPLKILLFIFAFCLFTFAFIMPLNPNGFWYQQFLPNIGNRQITDITFLDSLTGYSVTNNLSPGDTGYILKTTNGGDIWNYYFTVNRGFTALDFININTGYACGGSGGGTTYLSKTTNAGLNWFLVNSPSAEKWDDMSVLNNDTIWLVESENLTGGVFKTTNGGTNWIVNNTIKPDKIYMYNSRIGFSSRGNTFLYKTTNGGLNWNIITGTTGFTDMKLVDTLTGWKCSNINGTPYFDKTTNGGLNWFNQVLPTGGIILSAAVSSISILNSDTVWAAGGEAFYGAGQFRGILFRTTNGGNNWLFNVPDTTIHLAAYSHVQFINKRIGWAYNSNGGIHTTNGGDTTFITGLQQISNEVPKEFKLFQNYPNPFNPTTNIKYQISKNNSYVNLEVYDIVGRSLKMLINQKQNAGIYKVDFDGSKYASGVFFYKLTVTSGKEVFAETKKMLLIK